VAHTDDNKENEEDTNTTMKDSRSGKAQTEPEHKRTSFNAKDLIKIARAVVERMLLLNAKPCWSHAERRRRPGLPLKSTSLSMDFATRVWRLMLYEKRLLLW
jgi:hypothetical protein